MSTINPNNKRHFADHCELDETLKYSGLYTDLCGMSIEDFIKAGSCHCGDNGGEGGGDEPVTKKINLLTFKTNQNGNLTAYLAYAPIETITVNCTCEGNNTTFSFNDGGVAVSELVSKEDKLIISNVTFNPMEDEKYKYGEYTVINKESVITEEIAYTPGNGIIKFNELGSIKNITEDNMVTYKSGADGVTVSFNRPADTTFPEGFEDFSDEEYAKWVADNSYVPSLIVNKERFDNGEVKIFIGSDDMTSYFAEIDTVTVNGETHSIIVKFTDDESGVEQYLNYKDLKVCSFSADGDINVKYIIK